MDANTKKFDGHKYKEIRWTQIQRNSMDANTKKFSIKKKYQQIWLAQNKLSENLLEKKVLTKALVIELQPVI